MKLCIFGADGRTGVEVVQYAKEQGFEIVAFVYSEASNKYFPNDVEVEIGNVLEYDSVRDAIIGTDAVVCVLGHIKGSDPLMQTKGITNIVRAMKDTGVKRILSLTGTGARVKGDTPSLIDKILNVLVGIIDPDRINDGVRHVQVLQESGLDFTIVRVLKLSKSDKAFTKYTITEGGPAELQTSRKKVAKVLVDLVQNTKYFSKLPVISG
jgi:hypothetical protein